MENMNPNINIEHMEHPEDDKILGMLKEFEQHAKDGYLRLEGSDQVYVASDSEAHKKLKSAVSSSKAYSLGVTEHDGGKFALYSVNEAFFKS